jgi:hypothetical protein
MLGVVNSGFRRSVRMPVSLRTASALSARAAVRSRAAACTLRRRTAGSGRYASAMARWRRSRSSTGTLRRSGWLTAIDSRNSVVERRVSRNAWSSVSAGAEAQLLFVSCKKITLGWSANGPFSYYPFNSMMEGQGRCTYTIGDVPTELRDQKVYFNASCRIRGSSALVTLPKFAAPKVVTMPAPPAVRAGSEIPFR